MSAKQFKKSLLKAGSPGCVTVLAVWTTSFRIKFPNGMTADVKNEDVHPEVSMPMKVGDMIPFYETEPGLINVEFKKRMRA